MMEVINEFMDKAIAGNVTCEDLSNFLASLEFLDTKKEIKDVSTGQVGSRFYVSLAVKYFIEDVIFSVRFTMVNGIGIVYGEGRFVYNDVDDCTRIIDFTTGDEA